MTEHKLPAGSYDILLDHPFEELIRFTDHLVPGKIGILVDTNTKEHCLPLLQQLPEIREWHVIEIEPGEAHKNLDTCRKIWRAMMDRGFDRHSLLLNLGGGVIGDMGGFCAATYKRGIPFIQIPTTLLAQVDASVGGKLGIDFSGIKNSIGLFADPEMVFIHSSFLKTLPSREIRSGFAEVIKHALIKDSALFKKLETSTSLEQLDWEEIVPQALAVKRAIVEQDPMESGIRKVLNFGHTIGHALESLLLGSDKPALHGEAVAAGMICEAWLSMRDGKISEPDLERITSFIDRFFPRLHFATSDYDNILQLMRQDKKNAAGEIRFALLDGIGQSRYDITLPEDRILESLRYYL